MSAIIIHGTRMFKRTEYEVERVEKEALLGLIKWTEIVRRNSIGVDIHIETDLKIRSVFVNGKKL